MHPSKLKFVYLSLFCAYIFLLLPWSGFALKIKPDFMLLVLIFWLIRAPNLCNIGSAWFVGLFVDLATGGIFGQYALAYTITAFVAVSYQRRLVLFNGTQQLFYVLLLLLISQVILLILKTFSGAQFIGWAYFIPSITGVLLWFIAVTSGLNTGGRFRGK
ncbi:MAG: rod shape-determining protein MreD [Methylotenera sp.]|jgi:rod shape-determining protein MreD|nr:rod shape-determining protein MreD [Methylotenera sp.]PKO53881.1 MAG: rod shape-determining protein MreD [Betaproteobacteria bacterium HGW-Betaproteobacteria-20]